jgi:hypothetical protein
MAPGSSGRSAESSAGSVSMSERPLPGDLADISRARHRLLQRSAESALSGRSNVIAGIAGRWTSE